MRYIKLGLLVLAPVALTLAGCDDPQVKTGAAKVAIGAKVAADGAKDIAVKGAEKASEAATQTAMTTRIHAALRNAHGLDDSDINVDTVKKEIYLEGAVPSQEQRTKAEEIAREVAGSDYKIINKLTLRG
jgi:hyperosmotically inducible periplasmic protein